jgi:hypothetical protein
MDVGRRREADGGMEGFGYWEVLLDVERPREAVARMTFEDELRLLLRG